MVPHTVCMSVKLAPVVGMLPELISLITGQLCCVMLCNNVVAELQGLHPLEEELGARVSSVLALRMLYSSACDSQSTYSSFLRGMDPRLRRSIEPLDVLYFWRQAGGIEEGTLWMAVFAVDEVIMLIQTTKTRVALCFLKCSILHSLMTLTLLPAHLLFITLMSLMCICNLLLHHELQFSVCQAASLCSKFVAVAPGHCCALPFCTSCTMVHLIGRDQTVAGGCSNSNSDFAEAFLATICPVAFCAATENSS